MKSRAALCSSLAAIVVSAVCELSGVPGGWAAAQPGDDAKADRFIVVVHTSDIDNAATDANIEFGLTWKDDEGQRRGEFIVLPHPTGKKHEKGGVVVHLVKLDASIPVHHIAGAQIVDDMSGGNPSWHVQSIAIMAVDTGDALWLLSDATIGRWLDRKPPNTVALAAPMEKEFKSLGTRSSPHDLEHLAALQGLAEAKKAAAEKAITANDFNPQSRTNWGE